MKTSRSIYDAGSPFTVRKNPRVGRWWLDMVNNHLYWSDETFRIFGIPKEGFSPYFNTFYNAVHPDDRAALEAHRDLFIKGVIPMNIEHRITLPDGKIRYVRELGERIFDVNNRLVWLMGTVQEISERDAVNYRKPANVRTMATAHVVKEGLPIQTNAMQALVIKWRVKVSNAAATLSKLSRIPGTRVRQDLHLYSSIEKLINQITATRPMAVFFDTEMFCEKGLTGKVKLNIFRVVQEQLSNVVKYAYPSEVYVSLHRTHEKIFLIIRDNGRQLDIFQKANGICITDIVECTAVNNGKATMDSGPDRGNQLNAEFPINI